MQCSIFANPQPTILANPCGAVHFDLTYALSGSERGNVSLLPVYGGAEVKGLRARGEYGGFAIHGVSSQSKLITFPAASKFKIDVKLTSTSITHSTPESAA